MIKKSNFRETVASEMIRQLEAGTAPWQKPWKAGVANNRPFNPVTNKPYKGINSLWLEMSGYADPRFMTFNQAKTLGAKVRKGEKAQSIEYWQWTTESTVLDAAGKPMRDDAGKILKETAHLERPRVFYASVFNAEQIEGLEPYKAPELTFDPIKDAENTLNSTGVPILHDQADRAFYDRLNDDIHLPHQAAFSSAYEYYATALHEIGHATGAKHRMVREKGPFGTEVYAKEELMVEMASFMMSRELGLGHYPERHAAYVESWLSAIRHDKNYLFQAAAVSEKIREWVMEPEKRHSLERNTQLAFENAALQEPKNMPENEKTLSDNLSEARKERIYLAVPYKEKDEAKALGAKYERKTKLWFVPAGADEKLFAQWKAQPIAPSKDNTDLMTEFTEIMRENGLETKSGLGPEGEWHRASIEGEATKQNASYRYYLDGKPNIQIKNFKTDQLLTIYADSPELTPEQKAAFEAANAETKRQREAELAADRKKAAGMSFGIWMNNKTWATPSNSEYLKRKGVGGYGVKLTKQGDLIIPLRDVNKRVLSLQTVKKDIKLYTENGEKKGLYHHIDPDNKLTTKADTIIISEGYSTGATVFEATKEPVIVAFDSGNLKPVAENIRMMFPHATIVIAADNDHHLLKKDPFKNVGLEKAEEAAKAVGGTVLIPKFTDEEKDKKLTDWNDLSQEHGKDRAARLIRSELKKALSMGQSIRKETEMAL